MTSEFKSPQQSCIIPRMNIPDYTVTQMELKRNSGERGTRKFIAFQGIVYDVTDCPKWRTDLHEQLHFAGQDLTSELPDAPIRKSFFSTLCESCWETGLKSVLLTVRFR